MEIGARQFGGVVPVVVGAPHLGRYVVFGNLVAVAGGDEVFRIDRHPTMARHPVPPMPAADTRRHPARETHMPMAPRPYHPPTARHAPRRLDGGSVGPGR